jgi:hypothetical protein
VSEPDTAPATEAQAEQSGILNLMHSANKSLKLAGRMHQTR